jgi:cold shock CspA family protein
MTRGSVTKLVKSYGSRWGRIKPHGDDREVFFNTASLDEAVEFTSLDVGQMVEFEEHADNVNGAHAEHVVTLGRGASPQARSS